MQRRCRCVAAVVVQTIAEKKIIGLAIRDWLCRLLDYSFSIVPPISFANLFLAIPSAPSLRAW
jgi:hypothetical protein